MEITRSSIETAKGPEDWFTGDVYIDNVAAAPAPARVQANLVHFTPGARTAWHTHALGQTIFVTEGVGLCQRRGGPADRLQHRPQRVERGRITGPEPVTGPADVPVSEHLQVLARGDGGG